MKSYPAILIHPEAPGGRCSGTLNVRRDELFFESENINFSIPIRQAEITVGGASNRFVFFKDKSISHISVYTSEKSVLKDPAITGHQHLNRDISTSNRNLQKAWIAPLAILGVFVLFIAGLYLAKDAMVRAIAFQVPPSWEKKAGDQLFEGLSLQYHFIKNDSLEKEFLRTGKPLFDQVEKQGYKIDLYFVKEPTINAFALPGGKVIIQSGLITHAESWEEVMGVLSHELAHVTERHHLRGVINNLGIYTLVGALFGDISSVVGTIAAIGGDLASLANSRTFENEADERGWEYMEAANINPEGLVTFFETLKKEHATKMDTLVRQNVDLSFLSTHPNTQDRIDHLKKKAKNYKGHPTPLQGDFERFKKEIQEAE